MPRVGSRSPASAPPPSSRSRAPEGLTFRAAREADLDRLVEIHTSAFPDPRDEVARRRNFERNPLGPLEALRVVVRDGVPIAHAFLFGLEVGFGGASVPAAAIASVGVAPEARGSGVAGALLAHLHDEARARGDAVSILYPFRQGFYARHGYAPVTPTRRLLVHPAALPPSWRAARGIVLRAARGDDGDAIRAAYARAAARTTGWLTRPAPLWTHLLADERRVWIVAHRGDAIAGYVVWTLAQPEPHAATRLRVHELVADDDDVRRALLGCIGAQRDQVSEVEIEVDQADPLDRALVDADRDRPGSAILEHALGVVAAGPMLRLLDVPRALAARGYAHDGAVTLAVAGEGSHRLVVQGGVADVTPGHDDADVTLDPTALAAVLYGALPLRDAARLGWAHAESPAVLARATALLALPPYFAIDPF